jgi:beta-glucosidase
MRLNQLLRTNIRTFITGLFLSVSLGGDGAPATCSAQAPARSTFAAYDQQARAVLDRMTLAEKIGQMTQPDASQLDDLAEIAELHLGSVLSGGNSDPPAGNSFEAWRDYHDACQKQALSTRLAIPLLYGIDAVHGHSNVLGAVIFPHNIGLGCTRDPQLLEEVGRITALEMRATGIAWNFAPCVTVPRDERWGRTYEGFGEDPEIAGLLGTAAVKGMQRGNLADPLAVLACAKHFVGDGGTTAEMKRQQWQGEEEAEQLVLDQGNTQCDEATLNTVHLAPYLPAIEAGVGTIMPSYSSWNGVKCSGNAYLLTYVLKGKLGFDGFLISDWNAIDQIDDDYNTCIKISLNAGMDMFMVPDKPRQFIDGLTELVAMGEIPMERIDDAVLRILRVKAAMGLLDESPPVMADRSLAAKFGSDEHRAVARRAVQQSLVLLKNDGVLPLSKVAARIHVAGRGADDLGMQCGGWTIQWQGERGDVTTGGTTILAAIRAAVGEATEVTVASDDQTADGAAVTIVVVGELPYAEGNGDDDQIALSDEDRAAIHDAKSAGGPVVVVLLSGRPLVLGDVLDEADAVVAAWLPGTEGAGVTDVLFGDYPPTGKLAVSWPRSVAQVPINRGDAEYDPLFEFGFGLSY